MLVARLGGRVVFLGSVRASSCAMPLRRHRSRHGIPFADAATYAVGALEMAGGLALILGVLLRPVALVLAVNLVAAICTAGRVDGGAVNLGLAPLLVVVLVSLAVLLCAPQLLVQPRGRPVDVVVEEPNTRRAHPQTRRGLRPPRRGLDDDRRA